MALQGQLSDFNLAEILQLIASQQKSGFLVLEGQREMVFVFDKGMLISTRDRRSESADPLETYLRAYGFFSERQWKHLGFVRNNSSLDLTEILISEDMMSDEELLQVLKSIAQEMTLAGMNLRRGRYHFTATKGTPPGVRERYQLDVQAVLMESARRLDEEPLLQEALPSQALTFAAGPEDAPFDTLSETGQHILQLALDGDTLGRIIRRGRTASFVVRELLKQFCDEGYLIVILPDKDPNFPLMDQGPGQRRKIDLGLRSTTTTLIVAGLLFVFGCLRWIPLWQGETAMIGLAAPVATAGAAAGEAPQVSWLDPAQYLDRELRIRQLQAEVIDAVELYRYEHGCYPNHLDQLVTNEQISAQLYDIIDHLGWNYRLLKSGRGYQLDV